MLKLGNKSISNLFIGQKAATKAFLGQKLVWQKSTGLPYDAEVEYLESTGTQYIDMDVLLGSSDVVSLVGMPKNGNSFFGNVTDANTRFNLTGSTGVQRFYFGAGGSGQYDASITFNQVHSYVCGRTFSIDGEIKNVFTVDDFTGTSTAYMFARRFTSGPNDFITGRIYWLKVEHNGVLVRDFIPVRVGGVGYMYDRVSKQLFGNQGSGNFIVGPDVVEVEYLESTGTQYIDTGITPQLQGISKIDFKPTVNSPVPWGCLNFTEVSNYGRYFRGEGVASSATRIAGQRYVVELDGATKQYIVNGVVSSFSDSFFLGAANGNCWLFGRSDTATLGQLAIYSASFTDSAGVLVRDFIPVRVGMEGAMMDRLTRKIYRNAGTGAFKIGADKKETPLMCNSYVKDGLVAMWDGVENAGWGTHDANATSWKELISNSTVNISGNGTFIDNAFLVSTRIVGALSTSAVQSAIGSSKFTVEFVFSSAAFGQSIYIWGDPKGFSFTTLSDYAVRLISGGTVIAQTAAAVGQSTGVYSIARNDLTAKAYFDGNQLGNETTCAAIGNPTSGIDIPVSRTVNSIRLYSRALTAEEIAWNYEIDKRRFNLP